MKRYLLLIFLMVGLGFSATAEKLKYHDEPITKSLELEFNDVAKSNDAFISWDLVGDWDKFDYRFSQGKVKNQVFTIKAKEYKDFIDGKEGITLTIDGKSRTLTGDYTLSLKVKDVSKDLKFSKQELNMDLGIQYTGRSILERLLVPIILLLALVALLLLVLHLTAKFPKGLLQLGHETVRLKGKKMISVSEELNKLAISIPEGTEIIFVKKRFAPFNGPCIKVMNNCILERDGVELTRGAVIHVDEEIKGLNDNNGKEIIIRYIY